MAHLLLVAFIVSAFINASQAQESTPLLKRSTQVHTHIVTFGDLFENAGLRAETPIFKAPQIGTRGIITTKEIKNALLQADIEKYDLGGLETASVERPGKKLTQASIKSILKNEIAERLETKADNIDIEFASAFESKMIPQNINPNSYLYSLVLSPNSDRFQASFHIKGFENYTVNGRFKQFEIIPTLAENYTKETIIKEHMLMMKRVAMSKTTKQAIIDKREIIGKALRRAKREGSALIYSELKEPTIIQRNDEVTIMYNAGALALTVTGRAIESGVKGDMITVMNLQTKRTLSARIVKPGIVSLNPSKNINEIASIQETF